MAQLVIDGAAVAALMRSPDGPVARQMLVVGEQIKTRTIASLKPGFVRDFLGPRIVKRMIPTPEGMGVQVGSANVKTRPHDIGGNPTLAFDWPAPNGPGGLVFYTHVKHPGSDFSKYLQERLEAAVASMRGKI